MKTKINSILLVLIAFATLISCNDLFEKDISSDILQISSPGIDYASSSYRVMYWWDKIDGTLQYKLQIASPSFNSLQKLVLDTVFNNTESIALITLFPGKYEWRMRAENGTSETSYIIRSITIDSTIDLTNQEFSVSQPEDNYTINETIINFSWPAFPFTDQYEYQLADINSNAIKNIKTNQTAYTDTLSEGIYFWSIRAINTSNSTHSNYSKPRRIVIDITAPSVPILTFPQNEALVLNPVQLAWTRGNDVVADSILVTNDSTFANIKYWLRVSDSLVYTLPEQLINTTLFWKVQSIDSAGNGSGYSMWNKFTVTQ